MFSHLQYELHLQTVNLLHVNTTTHTPKCASHSHQLFHSAWDKRPDSLLLQWHHWEISLGPNSQGNKQISHLIVLKPEHYVILALCLVHAALACPGLFSAFCWLSAHIMPGLLQISLVSFIFLGFCDRQVNTTLQLYRHFPKKTRLQSDLSVAHPVQKSCVVSALERGLSGSLPLLSKQNTEKEDISLLA